MPEKNPFGRAIKDEMTQEVVSFLFLIVKWYKNLQRVFLIVFDFFVVFDIFLFEINVYEVIFNARRRNAI